MLRQNKITTNGESIRRWLRQGIIRGIPPENVANTIHTRNVANGADRESIRASMWWELAHKHLFEGFIEPKRKHIKACAEHNCYSPAFEKEVWGIISKQKMGCANPHIPYLLDAFLFNGQRIRMDDNYESREERIRKEKIEGR